MATSDDFPTRGAIPVGYGPEGIAVDGEVRRGYVACARSDSVALVLEPLGDGRFDDGFAERWNLD